MSWNQCLQYEKGDLSIHNWKEMNIQLWVESNITVFGLSSFKSDTRPYVGRMRTMSTKNKLVKEKSECRWYTGRKHLLNTCQESIIVRYHLEQMSMCMCIIHMHTCKEYITWVCVHFWFVYGCVLERSQRENQCVHVHACVYMFVYRNCGDSLRPQALPAFNITHRKAGGPGIRSRVTYVIRMKGGPKVKIKTKGQPSSERCCSRQVKGKAL